MTRAHLPAISALRFLAAGWVLLFHSLWFFAPVLPQPLAGMVANGYLGVNLFFLISGFILAHAYLTASGDLAVSRAEFWAARAARILPVYFLGWLAYLGFTLSDLWAGTAVSAQQWQAGAASALLLQAWWPDLALPWNSPGWSLSVEAFLYACFPVFLPLVARSRRPWLFALGAWLAGLVVPTLFVLAAPDGAGGTHRLATGPWLAAVKFFPPLHLGSFVAGIATGVLFVRGRLTWLRGPWWGLGLGTAFVGATVIDPGPVYALYHDGLLAPLFLLGIGWCAGIRWIPGPIVRLGEASYSLYILQYPLWELYRRAVEASGVELIGRKALAVYAVLATIASLLAFELLEKPARRAIRSRFAPAPARRPTSGDTSS